MLELHIYCPGDRFLAVPGVWSIHQEVQWMKEFSRKHSGSKQQKDILVYTHLLVFKLCLVVIPFSLQEPKHVAVLRDSASRTRDLCSLFSPFFETLLPVKLFSLGNIKLANREKKVTQKTGPAEMFAWPYALASLGGSTDQKCTQLLKTFCSY